MTRPLLSRLFALAALCLLSVSVVAAPPAMTPVRLPLPPPAADATVPRIGMATMQPGEEFWSRFGHDALIVLDASGRATSYNFGYFDPTEPDFISRFIRGDMRYRLVALPFEEDMFMYQYEGRGVSIQWLDLDDAQARELARALVVNARPENAFYRYQYFEDNCATRVRDAIDRVLDGGLRSQIEGRSHGSTYRSEAERLAAPSLWMWLSFDLMLGPSADRPIPVWSESYIPMRLADALRRTKNTQGRPLVLSEQPILPHKLGPEPQERPLPWWPWALAGVVLAVAASQGGRTRPRLLAAIALPVWTVFGLIGGIMLFTWIGTQHTFSWANQNALLLNPLCLLLWPGAWRTLRGREPGPWFGRLLLLVALCAIPALFLHWLPVYPQRNAHWIALLLPLHLGLWLGFRRRAR